MTQEFKEIFECYKAVAKQHKTVLATVVALDGSSYRKPGVRMLILDNGLSIGAVSGGCVEKEIIREAQQVFSSGKARMMHYDGRFRLGCEGLLYILIEPFLIDLNLQKLISKALDERNVFSFESYFQKTAGTNAHQGTRIVFHDKSSYLLNNSIVDIEKIACKNLLSFKQKMPACFQLLILGEEHDAIALHHIAIATGWEVSIVCSIKSNRKTHHFPGAKKLYYLAPEAYGELPVDDQTAIVIMSHNYAKDLQQLIGLKDAKPIYIGVLGAKKRKEKLLMDFLDYCSEVSPSFIDLIRGPAGIDIGAIGPKEIAISIVAEILSVCRNSKKNIVGSTTAQLQF